MTDWSVPRASGNAKTVTAEGAENAEGFSWAGEIARVRGT